MAYAHNVIWVLFLPLLWKRADVDGLDEIPKEWSWEEYPHPMVDTEECGRRDRPSLICDPNLILKFEQASKLDELLNSVRTDTRCPCTPFYCSQNRKGYRMAVALVNKMKPYRRLKGKNATQSVDDTLEMARRFTFVLENSKWASGQCGEDVVIFYSLMDNVVYAITGEKAREKLTDGIASEILMDNRRHLAPGKNIYKGLHTIVQEFKNVFMGIYGKTPTPRPPEPTYNAVIGYSAADVVIPYRVLHVVTLISTLLTLRL